MQQLLDQDKVLIAVALRGLNERARPRLPISIS
jgi:hypothetical protein